MNKACFVLIALLSQAPLFAGVTMVTQTTRTSTKCDFRVGPCDTSVEPNLVQVRYNYVQPIPGPDEVSSVPGDPARYRGHFGFADYASPQHAPTIDELVALIRKKLSNCPEVTITYDNESGEITLHYVTSPCEDCDWIVNVRNVKADDFVSTRTTDNYSDRLGQMERRKFHTISKQNAEDIQSACAQICAINLWAPSP